MDPEDVEDEMDVLLWLNEAFVKYEEARCLRSSQQNSNWTAVSPRERYKAPARGRSPPE
ncbi:hypothetical protein PC116_g2799 [Phytophthora cactorum]|uniref:Uncharacterized protein n=1 Tax=Phytophthora cactorum TaxID=29920 RepID=A0A8T1EEV0_9STRA|nr:hypothetical protein Pcac1_g23930 [Phytophthora cactorum]KAG2933486.1 hypothetical protein PC114_g1407 [Phytophthora cactorum]KAG2952870.1 hypothetical protein PC117_g2490 [Phytophthora cactorum]KAG3029878.1 hypothetical protein PC120_g4060 [Phytophthora cactorum]KAG3039952.1 hypothetical protein PC119_g1717 [Phytophthora cactorum]